MDQYFITNEIMMRVYS